MTTRGACEKAEDRDGRWVAWFWDEDPLSVTLRGVRYFDTWGAAMDWLLFKLHLRDPDG